MNYSLKITQLDTVSEGGQEKVVVLAHWAYTGTDGTNTASFGGTTPLITLFCVNVNSCYCFNFISKFSIINVYGKTLN